MNKKQLKYCMNGLKKELNIILFTTELVDNKIVNENFLEELKRDIKIYLRKIEITDNYLDNDQEKAAKKVTKDWFTLWSSISDRLDIIEEKLKKYE